MSTSTPTLNAATRAPRFAGRLLSLRGRPLFTPLNLHIAGIALLALVNLYLVFHMVYAYQQAHSQNEDAVAQQRALLTAADLAARPLQGLDAKLSQANADADLFYARRLPSAESQVLAELGALTTRQHVKLSRVQYAQAPILPGSPAELTEVRMDANLSGDYRPLVTFLNLLERDRLFFLISNIAFTGQQGGTVNLRLRLSSYLRARAPGAPVTPFAASSATPVDAVAVDPSALGQDDPTQPHPALSESLILRRRIGARPGQCGLCQLPQVPIQQVPPMTALRATRRKASGRGDASHRGDAATSAGVDQRNKIIAGSVFAVLILGLLYYELADVFITPTPPPAAPPVILTAPSSASARPAPGGNTAGSPTRTAGAPAATSPAAALDPTLHMQAMLVTELVVYNGSGRNIFSTTAAAPTAALPSLPKVIGPIRPTSNAAPSYTAPTGPPPLPPIDLKFFGVATSNGHRQAFLLHGDDVFLAAEGDIVLRKYRIVTISTNAIQIEDLTNNNKQLLPLLAATP